MSRSAKKIAADWQSTLKDFNGGDIKVELWRTLRFKGMNYNVPLRFAIGTVRDLRAILETVLKSK